jgi:hypothetical protein
MKRKQSFSLNQFIKRHGVAKKKKQQKAEFCTFSPEFPLLKCLTKNYVKRRAVTKKKKQQKVEFCSFSPEFPPPKGVTKNYVEELLHRLARQTVFNHLMLAMRLFGKHEKRWLCRRHVFLVDPEENNLDPLCYTTIYATGFDTDACNWLWVSDQFAMMEELVMPMACSFVHQTPDLSRIKKFEEEIEEFSAFLKQKYRSKDFYLIVRDHLAEAHSEAIDNSYDGCCFSHSLEEADVQAEIDIDVFARTGWDFNVGYLFLLVLESHKVKLLGIIEELEFLFESPYAAATVEDMIRKRVWEVLVHDWVKEWGTEEDYIRLYETEGALRWCLDYIVPEREEAKREADENRRQIFFFDNPKARHWLSLPPFHWFDSFLCIRS